MATQYVTVIGLVGRADAATVERVRQRPHELPVVCFSQWVDSWSPFQALAARIEIADGVSERADIVSATFFGERLARLREEAVSGLDPMATHDRETSRYLRELAEAACLIEHWAGTLFVEIRCFGKSLHDDEISAYMRKLDEDGTDPRDKA